MTKHKVTHHKVHHPKERDHSVSYVKVDDYLNTRKEILESAVYSAEILKDWEAYKRFREEKIEIYKKLVGVMNRIDNEVNTIRRHLPKMSDIVGLEIEKKEEVKPEEKPKKIFTSEIDKEIDEIREKIRSLRI